MSDAKIRGGYKARVTFLLGELQQAFKSDSITEAWVRDQIAELTQQSVTIQKLNETIISNCTDINAEITASSQFNIKLNRGIREGNDWLKSMKENSNVHQSKTVKLPNITLKTFGGDPLEWPAFWDLYKCSIHDRKDISDAAKFYYLNNQLEGDAALLLSDFDHTEEAYTEAISLLKRTFGKHKSLVQARLHALFDLQPPAPNATALGRFRSQYEAHIRGLKSLGGNITEAGYVFAAIILRKLPSKIADNINRASKSESWTLDELRESIEAEIDHLNAAGDIDSVQSNYSSKPEDVITMSMAKSNASGSSGNGKFKEKICQLCSGEHSVFSCTKYNSVEMKRKQVKDLNLCFNCLRKNHSVKNCRVTYNCRNCNKRHHSSVCDQSNYSAIGISGFPDGLPRNENVVMSMAGNKMHNSELKTTSILPTAVIPIICEFGVQNIRCLFDTGAQKSFILKTAVEKLGIKSHSSVIDTIEGINSVAETKSYPIVTIPVETKSEIINIDVQVLEHLPSVITMHGRKLTIDELKSMGISLADDSGEDRPRLHMIIGMDHLYKFIYGQRVKDSLYVIPSKVGNLIAGTVPSHKTNVCTAVTTVLKIQSNQTVDDDSEQLNQMLKNAWDLDHIGISNPENKTEIFDPVMEKFEKSIFYENGRYVVSLPWKDNHSYLPSNYDMAFKRMQSNISKLKTNSNYLNDYDAIINNQLKMGFIEKVEDVNKIVPFSKVHYLAHHAVFKASETTPLRIVFDCSAKTRSSPSLNDCLHSGPSLINELCSVLCRFRMNPYACVSDISKAFLQVGLNEIDRESTRFLWPEDPNNPESKINVYRFKVVLFGATCSQFLLNATVLHHLKNLNNGTAKILTRNIYVDNIQNTFCTEKEMIHFYSESKEIMQSAGFPLKQWFSNSVELNDIIVKNNDTKDMKDLTKILGINWHIVIDCLSVETPIFDECKTKREIVSAISKLYDPTGFFLPVTITGRILIQKIWKSEVKWDQNVSEVLLNECTIYLKDLFSLGKFHIKRYIPLDENMQLNVFCDASILAYGAVAYLTTNEGSKLIFAKARVAPIKPLTLPQLELTALNLGSRLAKFLISTFLDEIEFFKVNIWSDSTIALSWVTSDKKLPTRYVQTRVDEIHSNVKFAQFFHVSGLENSADLLTRGISVEQLEVTKNWWAGPTWLKSSTNYPVYKSSIQSPLVLAEISTVESETETIEYKAGSEFPIDVNRYGSYDKLILIMCFVIMFINRLQCKIGKTSHEKSLHECRNEAWELIVKHCQRCEFPEIFAHFLNNGKTTNLVKQLNLIFDEGFIKCKGRLIYSDLPRNSKFPILLPCHSFFSRLIINDIHVKRFHAGVNDVLAALRQKYWLPKARQVIKSELRKCVICKRHQGKPFSACPHAPLPSERVTENRAFAVVGLDYSGALNVKNNNVIIKVYIALFTCAVSRALHLEIVENCTEFEFLCAFRRFIARRSCPSLVISDNASTFISASKTLKQIFHHAEVKQYLSSKSIEWKFITKRAPWVGGFYERLIGLTKNSLRKTLGNALISLGDLRTIIVEIEAALNDRPLTYVSSDLESLHSLTPSHLLLGYRLDSFPDISSFEEINDPTYNEKSILDTMSLNLSIKLKHFWNRWRSEYLVSLREKHKCSVGNEQSLKVGQVVIVHEDLIPRIRWNLAVITKLLYSSDGYVRSAKIRTAKGNTDRPITKLYPLEVYDHSELEKPLTLDSCSERPKRKAAIRAMDKIKSS